MKKLNKKAAAGIGLGALALVGGTFAYYSQTASLDNPLSTGRYTTQLVESISWRGMHLQDRRFFTPYWEC